jgi:ribosomal protein S15P/S13E
MSTNLQSQIDQADTLIAKLHQIKALWDEIPSEDELRNLTEQAERLASALESADEELHSEDELRNLTEQAERLASALESARETYMSGDFPTEDALKTLTE